VPLTGSLSLQRGPDGLFTAYKERWDQPVPRAATRCTVLCAALPGASRAAAALTRARARGRAQVLQVLLSAKLF
jgi:hypothetical protein